MDVTLLLDKFYGGYSLDDYSLDDYSSDDCSSDDYSLDDYSLDDFFADEGQKFPHSNNIRLVALSFAAMYNQEVIYHVYNQSINYELLFRSDNNYRYFLEKIKTHLLPHADILCYCLMPDHFHFLLKPTHLGCQDSNTGRFLKEGENGPELRYQQNISNAFRVILSSYSKALNREHNRRGSLFKAKTKAKPGYVDFYPDTYLIDDLPFTQFIPYLKTCFYYIHNNPVKAQYTDDPLEWQFSSALDYDGMRDSRICNFDLTQKLLGIERRRPAG